MVSPAVSVVIPVLNGAAALERCLTALHAQVDAPAFEVIVVDNGSVDGSATIARNHPLRPTVLQEPRRGSYAARNTGVAAAVAPVVAFTDADCVPDPHWIAAGAAAAGRGSVVGGAVRPLRSPAPSVWERYDVVLYLTQRGLVEDEGFAATANLWVPRRVLEDVGPFRAELLSSGDLEWGLRAAARGFPTSFAEDVVVGHPPRTTALQTWRLHRRLGAGWAALAAEHPIVRNYRWLPLGTVIEALAADGPALRRRQVAHVHAVAMGARRAGWHAGPG
ncbi:MAG: glycosyl transferase family 2 [Frankiales bacterium]|nr:glycosyl transferase family 2 [Frankiales bacterium]